MTMQRCQGKKPYGLACSFAFGTTRVALDELGGASTAGLKTVR
jgi:hypothetical protein